MLPQQSYVFVIEVATRRVHVLGTTVHPGPGLGEAAGNSRQRPVRRVVRVRTRVGLPRPMAPEDVTELFTAFTTQRDRAIFLLVLDGGPRPGEVLGHFRAELNATG